MCKAQHPPSSTCFFFVLHTLAHPCIISYIYATFYQDKYLYYFKYNIPIPWNTLWLIDLCIKLSSNLPLLLSSMCLLLSLLLLLFFFSLSLSLSSLFFFFCELKYRFSHLLLNGSFVAREKKRIFTKRYRHSNLKVVVVGRWVLTRGSTPYAHSGTRSCLSVNFVFHLNVANIIRGRIPNNNNNKNKRRQISLNRMLYMSLPNIIYPNIISIHSI